MPARNARRSGLSLLVSARKRSIVVLVAELDHGEVVHGVVVAVVVQPIRGHRLGEIVGCPGLVVEICRSIAGHRVGERLLVGTGDRHGRHLLRLRDHPGPVRLLVQLLQRLQLLDGLAAGLGIGRNPGRIRVQRRLLLGLLGLVLVLAEFGHALGALLAHARGRGLGLGLGDGCERQQAEGGTRGEGEGAALEDSIHRITSGTGDGTAGIGPGRGRTLAESGWSRPWRAAPP